ncbi:MAG: sulfatase-like hydrolase/transferase, partial [Planctomycetota bacterium]
MVYTTQPPNILILITDQQSHALMSCAGTNWVKTPHLDQLAAGGMRFTRAYCSNPVCVPSRFSMFTGRMPSAIGMFGNDDSDKRLHRFTPVHDTTGLGHCLRQAGYSTWYGGKVHWPVELNAERLGFTYFQKDERERLAIESADLIHHLRGQRWAMVTSLINPHDICYQAIRYAAGQTTNPNDKRILDSGVVEIANLDEALLPPRGVDQETFLRDHLPPLPANWDPQRDEPELLQQTIARRPFRAAVRADWNERDWRLHRWAYARLMERVDRQIGVVSNALTASGQEQDTLVIMTSDHGDHGGSHRLEHKTFFYEEAARIPWIMRLPGRIVAGTVEDSGLVAHGLDLMATCCDYAGADLPAHCLGVSQRAVAEGSSQTKRRTHVYGENAVSRMIVERTWKYVRYNSGANAEQLYDLANDPGETRNHASNPVNAAVLQRLRLALAAEIAAHEGLALGPMPRDVA